MRTTTIALRLLLFSFVLLALAHSASAQVAVGISVNFGPPAIPVYEQPLCPGDNYIWTPGYWAYDDDDGYYWVPGTWVLAPEVGFLWTPGWWGWGGSAFLFHEGYWGPEIGFYGGINYGFGYFGSGYEGGRWEGGHFAYNTYVSHVDTTIIHNTYNVRVTNITENHVSFNGGEGGIQARPTPQQEAYANQHHVGPVPAQMQHMQAARANPELRASANHGKPPIAATARPGDFKTAVVPAREAGGEYKAPPANAARGNQARPGNEARPVNEARPGEENRPANNEARPTTSNHASELQPHTYTPPNTGNAKNDQKYQQQQQKLAAKQTQEHQKLQQQQEKEHQQAAKKNYNATQKQQMEQKHTQQTQQLEQKHAAQQKQMEQRQAPRQAAPKPPAEKR